MAWEAPIVGYVDNRGNLRCAGHSADEDKVHPVYGDGWFSAEDTCAFPGCGVQLEHIPSSKYIEVAFRAHRMAA